MGKIIKSPRSSEAKVLLHHGEGGFVPSALRGSEREVDH